MYSSAICKRTKKKIDVIIAFLFVTKPFFEVSISIPNKIMVGNMLKFEVSFRDSAMLIKIAKIVEPLDWPSR